MSGIEAPAGIIDISLYGLLPYFIAFLFGSALGSFLNVCIHRLPRSESIVFPPSHCPHCDEKIHPLDNIPILSFFLLGGKCRYCGGPISARYLLVEVATALLLPGLLYIYGPTWVFLTNAAFGAALIALIFIDLEHYILPDVITLPGVALGLLSSLWDPYRGFPTSLYGAIFGAGFLLAVFVGYFLIRKIEGMGLGDVKMLAMIGAFLGLKQVIFVLVLSSFLGILIGVPIMIFKKKDLKYPLPFGTFMGMGALFAFFFGETVLEWYFRYLYFS